MLIALERIQQVGYSEAPLRPGTAHLAKPQAIVGARAWGVQYWTVSVGKIIVATKLKISLAATPHRSRP
jgi:hypothetical protein